MLRILKKFQYNAPVILTYALISGIALVLSLLTSNLSNHYVFSVYRSPLTDPLTYPRLIMHVFGHVDFNHYLSNFLIILLVGPMLEEKYGSVKMLVMILITALVTGGAFLAVSGGNTALLGASGVAFMMILLSSFVNLKKGRIPLTVILVIILYLGKEAVSGFTATDNISHITHIIGGVCGALLGFALNRKYALIKKRDSVDPPLEGDSDLIEKAR
ncbi:MAG: rhomboid family intramembrane serine protease [Clostridiales bacterium]|jgi:membrane associated rhomboid family serine protease|nr:rhomboid family intramembrane serine protease [Clostridiales bacterium]